MVTRRNVLLSKILYYKIGGKARFVLEVRSVDDVFEAITFLWKNKIEKYLVVGLGANLLMSDGDYDGVVIKFIPPGRSDIHITSDGLISAFAGHTLDQLIHFSFHNGYIGLEKLGGLPSTIGGAVRGNAGAFGIEMKDVIVKVTAVEFFRDSYEVREFTNEECAFSYRDSIFKKQHNLIILREFFHL